MLKRIQKKSRWITKLEKKLASTKTYCQNCENLELLTANESKISRQLYGCKKGFHPFFDSGKICMYDCNSYSQKTTVNENKENAIIKHSTVEANDSDLYLEPSGGPYDDEESYGEQSIDHDW